MLEDRTFVRETAEYARETAEARMFNEDEHTAIVAATVERETAELTGQITDLTGQVATLTAENADLKNKVDVAEAAREVAEAALSDFRAEVETAREVAARSEERAEKVRAVLTHKPDEWFTADRVLAWAEMAEEDFTSFVAELAEVTAGLEPSTEVKPPRETAMAGAAAGQKVDGKSFYNLIGGN